MSSISINNCVFMGRLTGEPEMRYTRSRSQPFALLSAAVPAQMLPTLSPA